MAIREVFVKFDEGDIDLAAELKIDRNNLSEEMEEQASRYIYWAVLAEESAANVNRAKMHLEILEGELIKEYRTNLEREASGRITDTMVGAAVHSDKRYIRAREDMVDLQRHAGVMRSAERAFAMRKDALIQVAWLAKMEYGAQTQINREKAERT